MKRKLLVIMLVLLLATVACFLASCGDDEGEKASEENGDSEKESQGLEYTLSDDGTYYAVTGIGTCTDTRVVIPKEYEGKPVKTISACAFEDCTSITSAVLPEGLISIGDSAFRQCEALTSVEMPDSLNSVGDSVFLGCGKLQYNIYEDVKYLGNENNPYFVLYKFETGNKITYKLHEDTKIIASKAFAYCSKLKSLVIPNGVITIGDMAFRQCSALESVTMPGSVTKIENAAFMDCTSLASVEISNGLTEIGGYAFSGCRILRDVVIPDSVTEIHAYAFYGCSYLAGIAIPKSVAYMGENVFIECPAVKVYCEAESKPSEWASNWNGMEPFEWGHTHRYENGKCVCGTNE